MDVVSGDSVLLDEARIANFFVGDVRGQFGESDAKSRDVRVDTWNVVLNELVDPIKLNGLGRVEPYVKLFVGNNVG